jgi:hypothetical protein
MTKRAAPLLLLVALSASMFAGSAAARGVDQTLTVTKGGTGNGTVTSDVPGIDCGPTCSFSFPQDTVVTLTADAGPGSTFTGWSGDCGGGGTCQVTMGGARSVRAVFARSYRPDAWIKLCGLSTGCTIDPLPHPWHGNNIYNNAAHRQTIPVRMEDGEGVRFWILLENDGALADTVVVQGCQGTHRFLVNKVLLGKHKRPEAGVTDVTREFKNGTLSFDFGPSSERQHRVFTLNMIAPTTAEGVSYRCPITIHSQADPGLTDTVAVRITTY